MSISREIVLKTAKLCRLKVPEDKVSLYSAELSKILAVIDTLQAVNTEGVEPMINANEHPISMHEDKVNDGNQAEQILHNAPKAKFGYFAVPKVIE